MLAHPLVSVAAAECATASDRAALKTAAMQQELMVAALKCNGINEYNRFVLSHQPELISSDRALETYFQRGDKQRGTATYNKYKTELANDASLRSSRDPDSFCDAAGRLFDITSRPMSLNEIVAGIDLEYDRAIQNCPVLADNTPTAGTSPPPPVRTSRFAPDLPYPSPRNNTTPEWNSGEVDEDAPQSLDSQARSEIDSPPPNRAFDDDPDE
jgi:hypothetical protein